jgi:hypothetical protein
MAVYQTFLFSLGCMIHAQWTYVFLRSYSSIRSSNVFVVVNMFWLVWHTQQTNRWCPILTWLEGFLSNRKPILVTVFQVLLSIVQKNLTFDFIVSCFHSNLRRMYIRSDPCFYIIFVFRILSTKTLTHLYVTKCIYIVHIAEIIWKDNQCLPDP